LNAPRTHRVKSLVETFVKLSFGKTAAALLLLLLLAANATRAQEVQKAQSVTAAATPSPQPQPTPRPARTVLAGRVLGESGEPVTDAAVSLSPRAPGLRPRVGAPYTVGVDEGGNFRFEGLDPGLYDVYASLPGFVSETDSLSGRSLGPYRPGNNVIVRLVKGGVVTGTVTDSQGQPIATLSVYAMRVRDLDGAQTVLANYRLEGRTDDRGVYRIYGLRPGVYVVYAGGHVSFPYPFFAGYGEVTSFYPSGTRDTAAEVTVRSGQEVGGIDIHLRDDPARRLTGTVELPPGAVVENSVSINLAYASTGMVAGTSFAGPNGTSADRSFFFEGVADGEYDLQALVNNSDGVTLASAPQRVSVRGADVTGLRLTVVQLASASGTLRFEPFAEAGRPAPESCKAVRASQLPQETLITAAAASAPPPTAGRVFSRVAVPRSAPPDSTGAFTVRGLEAGRYRLSARLFDEALYVRAIQTPAPAPATPPQRGAQRSQATTTTDASRDLFDLKVGQQLSGLTVRVAEGAASFAGSLTAAEPAAGETPAPPPFSQLRVHLVPQERERAEDTLRYYEAPVAGDGTFAFKNLAPGRYLVVARPYFADAGEREPRPAALDPATRAALRREAESANTTVELQPCQRKTDFVLRFPPPTTPATK
jgi:protocatechuate 3,4-dioxygenase beta subunit